MNTKQSSSGASTLLKMAQTVRCLIMPGAHDNVFSHIAAKVDISLHRGDTTIIGGLRDHRKAIDKLSMLGAEVKLVIADNHEFSLDRKWWSKNVVASPYAAIDQFCPTVSTGLSLKCRGRFAGPE